MTGARNYDNAFKFLEVMQNIQQPHFIVLTGCQTNDKVGQFCLPTKSANRNMSSVMQKSADFVCR